MTPAELYAVIASLPAHTPLSEEFEESGRRSRARAGLPPVWYNSQRQHLLGWVEEYNSAGAYGRSNYYGTARNIYQRLQSPGALIWLAEALGETAESLAQAIAAADAAGPRAASRCGAIRKVVPWNRIVELIDSRPQLTRPRSGARRRDHG